MIKGKYNVYQDGRLLGSYHNVITNQGYNIIRNYLAGNTRNWAGALALGSMNQNAPSASDTGLEYELARYPISISGVRGSNISLIAEVDESFSGQVFELGIYPQLRNESSGGFDDRVIATFNENWTDLSGVSLSSSNFSGTEDNPLARSGYRSIIFNQSALTATAETSVGIDGYSNLDSLSILYKTSVVGNSQTIRLKFYDDQLPTPGTKYFDFAFDGSSLGYKKVSSQLAYFTEEDNFNDVVSRIELTSFSGTQATINIDSIKFDDTDSINPDFALVSRALIGQPGGSSPSDYFEKRAGSTMIVEYEMELV